METKKEFYSIDDCTTIEEVKEMQRQRSRRWYQANKERKNEYTKQYYKNYLSKEARENNCNCK